MRLPGSLGLDGRRKRGGPVACRRRASADEENEAPRASARRPAASPSTHPPVALITGAAGGLGTAIARALRGEGHQLILTEPSLERIGPLARELDGRAIAADLATPAGRRGLADALDRVDVFVSCAGVPASGPLLEFSEAQIDRALDVNLRAPLLLARSLGARMAERGRGHIVFVGSLSGKVGGAGSAVYSASKFGLRGLALSLREDLRPSGVGVTLVHPGFIRDAGMFAATGIALPFGVGTRSPHDVARAVLRALRDDPEEIEVASIEQRLGTMIAQWSPGLSHRMERWFGGEAISKAIVEAQRQAR